MKHLLPIEIRIMHLAIFHGEYQIYYTTSLVLEKVGISLVKINIYQGFKYQMNLCI